MIWSLNFGDGTSQTCWEGEELAVYVGSSLRMGRVNSLTAQRIRDEIVQGRYVRVMRPSKHGGEVPRVVHSVTEKLGS